MANPEFFRPAFDEFATEECLGNPDGKLAYAYIRVSSGGQAEEGRSGLPRQIKNIHDLAVRENYRVPWALLFADDASGFEIDDRPQLTVFLDEIHLAHKRAEFLLLENIDRLSRNYDWHQGYLKAEAKRCGVTCVFFTEAKSRLEQLVSGIVAQDGMELSKQRMAEGNRFKAKSGRVTARTPAFGYKLVDSHGNEGEAAKRDTHYAVREEEAIIVRQIYRQLSQGKSMRSIAADLDHQGIKPPKATLSWTQTQIRFIAKNEIYKGDFYAHRWKHEKIEKLASDGVTRIRVKHKVQYPVEQWIRVDVPPIVSSDQWATANEILDQNKRMARRNAEVPFLLTGLVKCSCCGYAYTGSTKKPDARRKTIGRFYRCSNNGTRLKQLSSTACDAGQLPCSQLDESVWHIVRDILLQPGLILDALERDATSGRNRERLAQITFLEAELRTIANRDDKLMLAFYAEAIDEIELAGLRQNLKHERLQKESAIADLRQQVLTRDQLEARKSFVLKLAEQIRNEDILVDPPFEVKQRIIKLVVNSIRLNANEKWFELEGVFGRMAHIVITPMGRGSSRR